VKRSTPAAVVLLSAALATAGCGGGSPSSATAASSPARGTQSYATVIDLDAAVDGGRTQCTGLTMQPTTTAKAQAACTVGSGRQLVLQLWRDGASRDAGVTALTTGRTQQGLGYCVVSGAGPSALWSVDASADPASCTDVAGRLGGRVRQAAAAH
jgi:hypothetical protein